MASGKLSVIAFLGLYYLVPAAHAAKLADGVYEGKIAFGKSSMTMALQCAQDQCQLDMTAVTNGGSPNIHSQRLSDITPVENLSAAQKALAYARTQKSTRINRAEFAEIIKNLEPLLNSDIGIDHCFNVHYGGEGYSLICQTEKSAWEKPSLLYLGALMANCGEGFCGYVIYPLVRRDE